MRTPALYYYALCAFCIVSLFVGIGHAADLSPAAGNVTKLHGFGNGHGPMSRMNLSCLEQQGFTLADLQAAKERNDTTSIWKLLDTCRPAPEANAGNVTHRLPKNFGNVTGSIERNGAKEFPFRNLSAHRTITGMTPESLAGNMTHKFTGANATLFRKGVQQNGTFFHPAVNGSGLSRSGTHLKGNSTAPPSFARQDRGIV